MFFEKFRGCTTSEKFVFVHETTQRVKCLESQRLLVGLDCSPNSSISILSKVIITQKTPARTTLFKGVNYDRKRARKSQPYACADVFQLCRYNIKFAESVYCTSYIGLLFEKRGSEETQNVKGNYRYKITIKGIKLFQYFDNFTI